MPPPPSTPEDLLDLKLLPSWVNEPARPNHYADFEGEDPRAFERGSGRSDRGRDRDRRGPKTRERRPSQARDQRPGGPRSDRGRGPRQPENHREQRPAETAPPVAVTV